MASGDGIGAASTTGSSGPSGVAGLPPTDPPSPPAPDTPPPPDPPAPPPLPTLAPPEPAVGTEVFRLTSPAASAPYSGARGVSHAIQRPARRIQAQFHRFRVV